MKTMRFGAVLVFVILLRLDRPISIDWSSCDQKNGVKSDFNVLIVVQYLYLSSGLKYI